MAIESSQFIEQKIKNWQTLTKLLDIIHTKGFKGLSINEMNLLGELYRETTADLAFSKTHIRDQKLIYYLNNLVARAHGYIYQTKPARLIAIKEFYSFHFPSLFRKTCQFSFFACFIFIFWAIAGFYISNKDETFPILIIPSSIIESIEQGKMWTQGITTVAPLAGSSIMTNNISVTLSAFTLGITFGIGTFYILAINGLLFGTITYLIHSHNMDVEFWSFVLPHGIIELSCIFIAGGAGFLVAGSLLLPGELRRRDALIIRTKQAVKLIFGCIPLLITAGIIEAFISPSSLTSIFKLFFAVIIGCFFYLYLFIPFNNFCSKKPQKL